MAVDIVAVARHISQPFEAQGMAMPKVIIKHWQDWMRIITAVNDQLGPDSLAWHLNFVTVLGVQFEYGGEWPDPLDNSDVR